MIATPTMIAFIRRPSIDSNNNRDRSRVQNFPTNSTECIYQSCFFMHLIALLSASRCSSARKCR